MRPFSAHIGGGSLAWLSFRPLTSVHSFTLVLTSVALVGIVERIMYRGKQTPPFMSAMKGRGIRTKNRSGQATTKIVFPVHCNTMDLGTSFPRMICPAVMRVGLISIAKPGRAFLRQIPHPGLLLLKLL